MDRARGIGPREKRREKRDVWGRGVPGNGAAREGEGTARATRGRQEGASSLVGHEAQAPDGVAMLDERGRGVDPRRRRVGVAAQAAELQRRAGQ